MDAGLPGPMDAEEIEKLDRMRAEITELYAQGTQFYSKRQIKNIIKQLADNPREIHVRDLKGRVTTIQVADVNWNGARGTDIHCRSLQDMLSFQADSMTKIFSSGGFGPYHSIIVRPDIWAHLRNGDRKKEWGSETSEASFQQGMRKWQASDSCKNLISMLEKMSLPNVKNIVAFGLSHPSIYNDYKTIIQHAAVLTIKDTIERRASFTVTIKCFAQDPMYLESDVSLLATFGIEILPCPQGLLMLDNQTIVFDAFSCFNLASVMADIAKPAMYFTGCRYVPTCSPTIGFLIAH